ncbi:hypothetical protein D3C85_1480500 [compost metagenome]
MAVAVGAGAQRLGALLVIRAGAGNHDVQAGQGGGPDGILPRRQPRHVGIEYRQQPALLAPALQIGQAAAAGGHPARRVKCAPVLPKQVVVRNQQDGNGFHRPLKLSINVR